LELSEFPLKETWGEAILATPRVPLSFALPLYFIHLKICLSKTPATIPASVGSIVTFVIQPVFRLTQYSRAMDLWLTEPFFVQDLPPA
jgi:hypothetical protein